MPARHPSTSLLWSVLALILADVAIFLWLLPAPSMAGVPGALALLILVPLGLGVLLSRLAAAGSKTAEVVSTLGWMGLIPAIFLSVGFLGMTLEPRYYAFGRFYEAIEPGMSRADLDVLLRERYPAGGARRRPQINHDTPELVMLFMDPENPPNGHSAEGIFVRLAEGKVVRKDYQMD